MTSMQETVGYTDTLLWFWIFQNENRLDINATFSHLCLKAIIERKTALPSVSFLYYRIVLFYFLIYFCLNVIRYIKKAQRVTLTIIVIFPFTFRLISTKFLSKFLSTLMDLIITDFITKKKTFQKLSLLFSLSRSLCTSSDKRNWLTVRLFFQINKNKNKITAAVLDYARIEVLTPLVKKSTILRHVKALPGNGPINTPLYTHQQRNNGDMQPASRQWLGKHFRTGAITSTQYLVIMRFVFCVVWATRQ
jgi:hypothetical protein